ncbi:hypothetical protein M8818_001307 [Zalaria obscura]|uniref:Uncharacterized protein n=1 Tax=Zalaria obscura TaxID=2024903 RepID=A0ACC3SKS1_9PEZI
MSGYEGTLPPIPSFPLPSPTPQLTPLRRTQHLAPRHHLTHPAPPRSQHLLQHPRPGRHLRRPRAPQHPRPATPPRRVRRLPHPRAGLRHDGRREHQRRGRPDTAAVAVTAGDGRRAPLPTGGTTHGVRRSAAATGRGGLGRLPGRARAYTKGAVAGRHELSDLLECVPGGPAPVGGPPAVS